MTHMHSVCAITVRGQALKVQVLNTNNTLVPSSETRGEKVDCGQGTDSNEHSRWVHEGIADNEVSGMAEQSQYGIRQR